MIHGVLFIYRCRECAFQVQKRWSWVWLSQCVHSAPASKKSATSGLRPLWKGQALSQGLSQQFLRIYTPVKLFLMRRPSVHVSRKIVDAFYTGALQVFKTAKHPKCLKIEKQHPCKEVSFCIILLPKFQEVRLCNEHWHVCCIVLKSRI